MMIDNPLTPENDKALGMYYKVANQFCYDLHMGPYVLESHGYRKGCEETNELLDKLIIIHALKQKKEPKAGAGIEPDNDSLEFGTE